MADPNKNREALRSKESPDVKEAVKVEVKQTSAPSEASGVREALGGIGVESAEAGVEEGVEIGVGKVSEKASEGKERKSSGMVVSASDDDAAQVEALIQQIINSKPTKTAMLKDIKKHFKKEKKVLRKKMKISAKKGDWNKYNSMVARLRQIREIFSGLAHATYEAIKNVWLKVVHGIV